MYQLVYTPSAKVIAYFPQTMDLGHIKVAWFGMVDELHGYERQSGETILGRTEYRELYRLEVVAEADRPVLRSNQPLKGNANPWAKVLGIAKPKAKSAPKAGKRYPASSLPSGAEIATDEQYRREYQPW